MSTISKADQPLAEVTPDPIPTLVIEPSRGWLSLQLGRVWAYRELLYFLVWRDVKVRYKQTALGVGWIILQPLLTTTIIFSTNPDGGPLASIPGATTRAGQLTLAIIPAD